VFGGLGTDPNSMLPQAVLLAAGLLTAAARPAPGPVPATVGAAAPLPPAPLLIPRGGLLVLRPGPAARRLGLAFGTASASAVLAVWAVVMVVLLGAAPMAIAAAHRGAARADAAVSSGYNFTLTSATERAGHARRPGQPEGLAPHTRRAGAAGQPAPALPGTARRHRSRAEAR